MLLSLKSWMSCVVNFQIHILWVKQNWHPKPTKLWSTMLILLSSLNLDSKIISCHVLKKFKFQNLNSNSQLPSSWFLKLIHVCYKFFDLACSMAHIFIFHAHWLHSDLTIEILDSKQFLKFEGFNFRYLII